MEVSCQLHAPGFFSPGVRVPGTHWIGGWMGPIAGLDAVEYRKSSCLCRESNPDRPARSSSLFRLSYPGFETNITLKFTDVGRRRMLWLWLCCCFYCLMFMFWSVEKKQLCGLVVVPNGRSVGLCLQESATGPCPGEDESRPHPPVLFVSYQF
jgi:hypothetical protein